MHAHDLVPWREIQLSKMLPKRTVTALAKLEIHTVGDLLGHYPTRYAEPGERTDLSQLEVGAHVTVSAMVEQATLRSTRNGKAILTARVSDGTTSVQLTFFARHPGALRAHEYKLKPGAEGLFTGTVSEYRGDLQLAHPQYQLFGLDVLDEEAAWQQADRPKPIYRASSAIASWQIERAVSVVLDWLEPARLVDVIPENIRGERRLLPFAEAINKVHRPSEPSDWQRARARLRFEEAFVLQLALLHKRRVNDTYAARGYETDVGGLVADFDAQLPYERTGAQQRVGAEISADLARTIPMQRMLQGDVGSGKTLVALRAMLQVVAGGGQAALLAPTEVLAAQHLRSVQALLANLNTDILQPRVRVALLTGSLKTAAKRQGLADAASGQADIIIGTHALLSEQVQFYDLGLVVVDEQHRFGVRQRDKLRDRQPVPHLLTMTATPIPRSIAMTIFGDLDTSTLDEMPPGRGTVVTHVVPAENEAWRRRMWQRAREEIAAGNRVYVVCPVILEEHQGSSVAQVYEELEQQPELREVRMAQLHGRMTGEDKDRVMRGFASGEIDLLVSTTVIEVGVDVAEATMMVILDADRFGISQLHQLRGRIGRAGRDGLCLLVSETTPDTLAGMRLSALAESNDGFVLSQRDLELRKEGNVLGGQQSGGMSSLKLLSVTKHGDIIRNARSSAQALLQSDGDLTQHPDLAKAIEVTLYEHEEYLDKA